MTILFDYYKKAIPLKHEIPGQNRAIPGSQNAPSKSAGHPWPWMVGNNEVSIVGRSTKRKGARGDMEERNRGEERGKKAYAAGRVTVMQYRGTSVCPL